MQKSCEKGPFHIQNQQTDRPVLTNGKHPGISSGLMGHLAQKQNLRWSL